MPYTRDGLSQAGTLFMHHRPSYGNCAAHQIALVERANAIAHDRDLRGVSCACRHFRSKDAETLIVQGDGRLSRTSASACCHFSTARQSAGQEGRRSSACFWRPGVGCESP